MLSFRMSVHRDGQINCPKTRLKFTMQQWKMARQGCERKLRVWGTTENLQCWVLWGSGRNVKNRCNRMIFDRELQFTTYCWTTVYWLNRLLTQSAQYNLDTIHFVYGCQCRDSCDFAQDRVIQYCIKLAKIWRYKAMTAELSDENNHSIAPNSNRL